MSNSNTCLSHQNMKGSGMYLSTSNARGSYTSIHCSRLDCTIAVYVHTRDRYLVNNHVFICYWLRFSPTCSAITLQIRVRLPFSVNYHTVSQHFHPANYPTGQCWLTGIHQSLRANRVNSEHYWLMAFSSLFLGSNTLVWHIFLEL